MATNTPHERVSKRIAEAPRPLSISLLRPGAFPASPHSAAVVDGPASYEWTVEFVDTVVGMTVETQEEDAGEKEIVVVDTRPPASGSGVRRGDIVLEVTLVLLSAPIFFSPPNEICFVFTRSMERAWNWGLTIAT